MAFKFNPFTRNLDLVGSGGGGPSYIDGVADTAADLPVTLGNPPLDSVFVVKQGSGVWFINRKPSGLYCRIANNGDLDDWEYLGAFPEVNADGNWALYNSSDPTKELKFDVSGITTGTTRTFTFPDADGTLALTSDIPDIGTGSTEVAAGDHTHELDALDATGIAAGKLLAADGTDGAEWISQPIEYVIACSDETSDLATGTAKVTFRAPVAFLLTAVAASVNTAPTGSTLIVDINNGADSTLSTKLSIDADEKTSATAASAAVIDTDYDDIAADAEITIDIDQIGSTVAGKGLKVILRGTRA